MTDTKSPKSASIPQWQRQAALESSKVPDKDSQAITQLDAQPETLSSRAVLLEQASKFLEDEGIRDAPTERKISFLESKGLAVGEIKKVLEDCFNEDATIALPDTADASPSPNIPKESPSMDLPSISISSPSKSCDIPPIITYPEFLLHSQKPPPLITTRRLLNTLYLASGAAAALYGTSKYIVSPMVESLTEARHSLFGTASSNLKTLNEKLEKVVSIIPDSPTYVYTDKDRIEDMSETSSIISDPTELFHRDIATQTSLPQSPSATASFSLPEPNAVSAITSQTSRLQTLHSNLLEFLASANTLIDSDEGVKDNISDLESYLDKLAYGSSTYVNGYVGFGGNSSRDKDDEIAKFKADIRSVKGVLLNARSFPATAGRGRVGA